MKPDTGTVPAKRDRIDRAHLRDPTDRSHTMYRHEAPADLAVLVERFWVPVWSVPVGQTVTQRVLQYPAALLVITADYARFYGVSVGLSTTTLSGDGWAVGVLCRPAAGYLIAGRSMVHHTDRAVELAKVTGSGGAAVVATVREQMAPDPHDEAAHRSAVRAVGGLVRRHLPVDAEGRLINDVVAFVDGHSEVVRVAQVCDRFGLAERALQRLVRHRLGLTPKWLIQRRRLQEAAQRLRAGTATLAQIAADLGYADQPHLTRDFHAVTGMTPGAFAARHADVPPAAAGDVAHENPSPRTG